ncbi:MAG: polysaccharide deacetylase family protein [Defluviitaleaceae bacterium]|nr:polysaccharide deacetylase family protein [Defluviitaleaceae bacterium]
MKRRLLFAFCVVFVLIFVSCSSSDGSTQSTASNTHNPFSAEEATAPSAGFLRFYRETSNNTIDTGQALGISFQPFHQDEGGFSMDLVYPISPCDDLNYKLTQMTYNAINDFLADNTSGYVHMRPKTYAYGEYALGVVLDLRFYGDTSGFSVKRLVVNYNLEKGEEINLKDLFVNEANFRDIFSDFLGENFHLTGKEYFTFNEANLFIHVQSSDRYFAIPISLEDLGDIWKGLSPEPQCDRPRMAITFDDGPHYRLTPILLDALAERGVHATFFLLGASIVSNPEIVERMHREGHQIGNHSYSHSLFTRLTRRQIMDEIEITNYLIYQITGEKPTLLRPPYGAFNDMVLEVAEEMGMSVVMWSVDPQDWRYLDANVTQSHIVKRSQEGSVILLHDIHTSSIYGAIYTIDRLMEKGYNFVTVGEMYRRADLPMEAGGVYRGFYRDLVGR